MIQNPLTGAFARVNRASEHLADVKPRIEAIRDTQNQFLFPYFDAEPPHEMLVNMPVRALVTMAVPILVGEVAYNLRSALDYLVFELAKLDSGSAQKGTQFPIEDAPKGFAHRCKTGWLKGINGRHIAAIERLQPYNGVDWTRLLRDLSNPDKHREFVGMLSTHSIVAHTPIDPEYPALDLPIRRTPHPTLGEVNVKINIAVEVLFADGAPVVQTLEKLVLSVRETLVTFESEF